jgi:hypothetical protein
VTSVIPPLRNASDDHRFTNLVGGFDTDVPVDGKYSITWLDCWWASGCVDRMIRGRNAQNDMLNCYRNSSVASKNIHLSPETNGTCIYVETIFRGPAIQHAEITPQGVFVRLYSWVYSRVRVPVASRMCTI